MQRDFYASIVDFIGNFERHIYVRTCTCSDRSKIAEGRALAVERRLMCSDGALAVERRLMWPDGEGAAFGYLRSVVTQCCQCIKTSLHPIGTWLNQTYPGFLTDR